MKKLRSSLFLLIITVVVGLSILHCSNSQNKQEILIGGSLSVLPCSEILAKAFQKQESNTEVICEGAESTSGFLALDKGAIDIALMSRGLNEDEDNSRIKSYTVAKHPILIGVHPGNPISNLTTTQVKNIYLGKITNWQELGGVDKPIKVLSYSDKPSSFSLEVQLLDGGDVTKTATLVSSLEEMKKVLSEDQMAIGYMFWQEKVTNCKILTIDGVFPYKTTVISGRYTLCQTFYFLTYNDNSSDVTNKFIRFALSSDGQDLLENAGLGLVRVY